MEKERWTEEGKIKSWGGEVRDEGRGKKQKKRGKREEWQMIADVCQGIT